MTHESAQRSFERLRISLSSQDSLLCDMELPLGATFYPLGYPIEIITNDARVLEAAAESFRHASCLRPSTGLQIRVGVSPETNLRCPPEPTRREYSHLYLLAADVENQALLDLKTGTNFLWLNQAAIANRLYLRHNFLEKSVYLLLGASVVTDLHAACVSKEGKGILLCGASGAGKSTLSYACARAGWCYTSDDTCYLINNSKAPRVIGHSHRVRFRPSSRALFPELENFELTPRMEGKPSIEVLTSLLPVPFSTKEVNVHSIVYLNRFPAAVGKLISLPTGTATHRMRQELYSAGEIRMKHEKNLEAFFEIPTYELQYGRLDQAICQLESLYN